MYMVHRKERRDFRHLKLWNENRYNSGVCGLYSATETILFIPRGSVVVKALC
jgi:hypothetical protein